MKENMTGPESAPQTMSLDELLELRGLTERISGFLHKRLKGHLATLAPLLAPARVFGKYVGGREPVARSEEAVALLAEKYKQVCGGTFDLKQELDDNVLTAIGGNIEVYPYEYSFEAKGAKSSKVVSMTSSVRWVVTYSSEYSLSQLRALMFGPGDRRSAAVRQFVVNALAFQVVLGRNTGISQILKDLRYEVAAQPLQGLEKLPMIAMSLPLPSFRPPDDLLLTAIRLSGVSGFIELVDPAAVQKIEDPLRAQVESLSRESA
jgi:hypothetical protein